MLVCEFDDCVVVGVEDVVCFCCVLVVLVGWGCVCFDLCFDVVFEVVVVFLIVDEYFDVVVCWGVVGGGEYDVVVIM